jgi:radical SAM superfamily enzyme YgiQ (UPF0313 family)
MKISYIEPALTGKKRVERIFGCSYANYPFPNLYVLIIFAMLENKHEVRYDQGFLYFRTDAAFKRFVDNDASDIYLIFSVNLSMGHDINFAKSVVAYNKNASVIFLGPAPTLFADKFLLNDRIYVVRGEPDYSVPELVEAIGQKKFPVAVKGVSYVKNKNITHNPSREPIEDLDALPLPARHFLKKNSFYNPKLGVRPFTSVFTSRGCSHRCIYCVPCALNFARELEFKKTHSFKPQVRVRSAANVIEEFRLLKDEGYRSVSIIDDQFVWDKKRAIEICNGIKDMGIAWGCLSRADHLDEDIVKAMKEAGCKYVDMGVESFVQDILDYTKKDITVEKLVSGIDLLKKYGIFVKLNILFGASPYETVETMNRTLEKIKEVAPDQVMFDVCSPFPGTEFYEIAKKEKWLTGGEYTPIDVASSANISYPHLTARQLEDTVRAANSRFFFNPGFIFKNMLRLKRPAAIIDALRATFRKVLK